MWGELMFCQCSTEEEHVEKHPLPLLQETHGDFHKKVTEWVL